MSERKCSHENMKFSDRTFPAALMSSCGNLRSLEKFSAQLDWKGGEEEKK